MALDALQFHPAFIAFSWVGGFRGGFRKLAGLFGVAYVAAQGFRAGS